METNEKSPSAKELLRRIQELEARHAVIKQQISATKLTVNPYLSILQSMGQSVFIYDVNHRIIFWNQGAENLYGYTVSEVMGRIPTEVLAEAKDASVSETILERTVNGESWCGQFPIKNKSGESFVVVCSNTPFRDENGVSMGAMCVSTDSRPFQLTSSTALKALKVKSNMKIGGEKFTYHDNHSVNVFQSTPRGPFGAFFSSDIDTEEHYRIKHALMMASGDGSEYKPGIRRHLSLKEKENKKEIVSFDTRQRVSSAPAKLDYRNKIQAIGLKWLSRLHVNSTSMDDEILWEDLTIKQQIGRGSCGTVYHGLWYGSDVAVKVFAYQEFSNDVMLTFRQEVSLMKRLRHPNILLFMGAVTSSPQHLCIVTEFLPRLMLFF